jgi:hypothetical protein
MQSIAGLCTLEGETSVKLLGGTEPGGHALSMGRAVALAGDAATPMKTVAISTAVAPARTTLFTRMAGC